MAIEVSEEKIMKRNKRKTTRSRPWPDTWATITMNNIDSTGLSWDHGITGLVYNIGADGMFLKTDRIIPVSSLVDILIVFESQANVPLLYLPAEGKIVRETKAGVGIQFTQIRLDRLKRIIICKLNQNDCPSQMEER